MPPLPISKRWCASLPHGFGHFAQEGATVVGRDQIRASLQQHIHQLGLGMRRIAAIGPVHGRGRDLRHPIAVIAMVDATDCTGKESSAPLAAKISLKPPAFSFQACATVRAQLGWNLR